MPGEVSHHRRQEQPRRVAHRSVPRQPEEWRHVHAAADRAEPRLARAFQRSVSKMRTLVSTDKIAKAMATGDSKRVLKLFTEKALGDALEPAAAIAGDALSTGGRVGARILSKAGK